MSEIVEKINEFFTGLFGDIGKWVMLGVFVIIIALAITLLILAIVNFEQILGYGLLVLILVGGGFHIYKKSKEWSDK